jgi:hypothetical protein
MIVVVVVIDVSVVNVVGVIGGGDRGLVRSLEEDSTKPLVSDCEIWW